MKLRISSILSGFIFNLISIQAVDAAVVLDNKLNEIKIAAYSVQLTIPLDKASNFKLILEGIEDKPELQALELFQPEKIDGFNLMEFIVGDWESTGPQQWVLEIMEFRIDLFHDYPLDEDNRTPACINCIIGASVLIADKLEISYSDFLNIPGKHIGPSGIVIGSPPDGTQSSSSLIPAEINELGDLHRIDESPQFQARSGGGCSVNSDGQASFPAILILFSLFALLLRRRRHRSS